MDNLNNYIVCNRCQVLIDKDAEINPVKFSFGKPVDYDELYSKVCKNIEKRGDIKGCCLLDKDAKNYINKEYKYDKDKDYLPINTTLDYNKIGKEILADYK